MPQKRHGRPHTKISYEWQYWLAEAPRSGNPSYIYPVTAQPPARPFFAGTIFTDNRKAGWWNWGISDDTAMPKNDNISKAPKIFSGLYLYYHDFHFLNCSAITHNALLILISPSIPVMALVLVFFPEALRPDNPPFIIFSWTRCQVVQRSFCLSSQRRGVIICSGVTGVLF